MSAPDSLRDTLAHALLGTSNVSVYGVGDEWENALTAADFMLREYDWPGWTVAQREPSEAAKLALARIFCLYGDTYFEWDEPLDASYGNTKESREYILNDCAKALRAAYAIDWPWPGAGPADVIAALGGSEKLSSEDSAALHEVVMSHTRNPVAEAWEAAAKIVDAEASVYPPGSECCEALGRCVRKLLRGSVPGGSPTGERE